MSVVNKMLRDLEERKHQPSTTASYVPTTSKKKPRLLVFICLLVASCAVGYYGFAYNDKSVAESSVVSQQAESNSNNTYAEYKDNATQIEKKSVDEDVALVTEQKSSKDTENTPVLAADQASEVLSDASPVSEQLVSTAPANIVETAVKETAVSNVVAQVEDNSALQAAKENQSEIALASVPEAPKQSYLQVKPSSGDKVSLSSLREQAHIASQRGDDQQVIAILGQIVEIAPQEHSLRKKLAALLFSKQRIQAAQTVLNDGLLKYPEQSSLRIMLARTYFRAGDNNQAFNILFAHPSEQIANDELLSFRAALGEKTGNYQSAVNDYSTLVKRYPNQAKWWLGLGLSQDKQQLSKQALTSYQQAQALNQLSSQVDEFLEQRIQLLTRQS